MDEKMDLLQDVDIGVVEVELKDDEVIDVVASEDVTDVFEDNSEVTQTETMEYIIVEEPEEIVVDVSEAFTAGNGVVMPEHTHVIGEIEKLEGVLDTLGSTKDIYSVRSGYAEFQKWQSKGYYNTDKYYNNTGGVGFFVCLVQEEGGTSGGNLRIDICKKENNDGTVDVADVYGVTVDGSGFCGNQNEGYNSLHNSGSNKASSPDYAKVCLLGNVKVRVSAEEHRNINVGDYVIPNELGCAKKSDNNIGFKVISKGQIESVGSTATAWHYVGITLVPQNDNVSRVMDELEKTQVNMNNVNIQLGEVSNTINGIYDINIGISDKFNNIQDIVVGYEDNVNRVVQEAKEVVNKAEQKIEEVSLQYTEAVSKANEAEKALFGENGNGGVLSDIETLQKDMNILAQWPEGVDSSQAKGVAGFVAQAEKDRTQLASLTKAFGENGADLTTIIQKIDENGAAIQHLVTHVDKYILGEQSPAEGLTLEQTSFIQPGIIYVPTKDHLETYKYNVDKEVSIDFKAQVRDKDGESLGYGASYIWKVAENKPYSYIWEHYKDVYLSKPLEPNNGDLWYCWQGEYSGDILIHNAQTLYMWKNKTWIAVASVDDGNSTSIGSVNQTAKNFQIAYTNLQGNVASLEVKVDEISSTVKDEVQEQISSINQTAEQIMMGVYDADDGESTSLGLLLDGMTSTSTNINTVKIKEVLEIPPSNVDKYELTPLWNGTEFVPVGEPSSEGKYYFNPDDIGHTYYCEASEYSYSVYGINNIAMANLSTRVTDTESEVASWTRFQKGQNETLTSINQTSDEDGAAISSMVYGDFRKCVEIKLELTDEEKAAISTDRYNKQPKWENSKFVFDGDIVDNGEYCLQTDGDRTSYYKLLYRNNDVIGYEKYEMKSSPYASIVQKVEDGKSSIGLVAGDDDDMGSVMVNTINDKSTVTINADKIGIYGTTTFADILNPNTTTISGDYIRSGILESNNYDGPQVYKKYGVIIDKDTLKIKEGQDTDFIYVAAILEDIKYDLVYPDQLYIELYSCNSIDIDKELDVYNLEDGESTFAGYIISESLFELTSNSINNGMKIDLNQGAILSKDLIYYGGNLSITGNVNATSGTIGGFTIAENCLKNNQNKLYYTPLIDLNYGNSGVYISPEGIGLGNGRFYIDKDGNVTMNGNITFTNNSSITWDWKDNMESDIYDLANGTYTKAGTTFISGKSIYSPNIYADEFHVYPEDKKENFGGSVVFDTYIDEEPIEVCRITYSSYGKTSDNYGLVTFLPNSKHVDLFNNKYFNKVYASFPFDHIDFPYDVTFGSDSKVTFTWGATVVFDDGVVINGLPTQPARFG